MGKLARTAILSVLFVGAILFLIAATGNGAQAWASVRPFFAAIAGLFKITLPN